MSRLGGGCWGLFRCFHRRCLRGLGTDGFGRCCWADSTERHHRRAYASVWDMAKWTQLHCSTSRHELLALCPPTDTTSGHTRRITHFHSLSQCPFMGRSSTRPRALLLPTPQSHCSHSSLRSLHRAGQLNAGVRHSHADRKHLGISRGRNPQAALSASMAMWQLFASSLQHDQHLEAGLRLPQW